MCLYTAASLFSCNSISPSVLFRTFLLFNNSHSLKNITKETRKEIVTQTLSLSSMTLDSTLALGIDLVTSLKIRFLV